MKKLLILALAVTTTAYSMREKPAQTASIYTAVLAGTSYASYLAWQTDNPYLQVCAPALALAAAYSAAKAQQYWRLWKPILSPAQPAITWINEHANSPYVVVFAHGFVDTKEQAYQYTDHAITQHPRAQNNEPIFTMPCVTFNFADAVPYKLFNPDHVALGQEADCQRLYEVYQEVCRKYPNKKIILFGLSRGASTVLNLVSDSSKDFSQLAGIGAEAPFDDFNEVLTGKKLRCGIIPGGATIARALTGMIFPRFDLDGTFPAKRLQDFPQNLPALIISSKEDTLVPPACAERIVQALPAGTATLCMLQHGKHGKYILGKSKQEFAQAFKDFMAHL